MRAVLTGPARSGKSTCGLRLAIASGAPVAIAVGAQADDEEMARRIARHQAERPAGMLVIETAGDRAWMDRVPEEACLLVDCLGTVLGAALGSIALGDEALASLDAELEAERIADDLVARLLARSGPTVVVTNEVGWGIVPATALGRLFRDTLGRANRRLIAGSDAAWLVVAGHCINIRSLPEEVSWPQM